MLKVFIGFDHRQAVSYNVLQHSIITKSSLPVAVIPLMLPQLPIARQGLTPFTWSRFLVPHLCDYEGTALFLDADIILNDDVAKLFALAGDYAVSVAQNKHKFEWASVMLFNCDHPDNKKLTPEYIQTTNDALHQITWTNDIGNLPPEWNHLVGYDEPKEAKLIHYTQGVPLFKETNTCEHADLWYKEKEAMNHAIEWVDLMGNSVHAVSVNNVTMPKYLFDIESRRPHKQHEAKLRELLA